MDTSIIIIGFAVLILAFAAWLVLGRKPDTSLQDDLVRQMTQSQAELAMRLQVMSEAQNQLSHNMEQRLETVTKRLGDGLSEHSKSTGDVIKQVHERLAVIDTAQKNLTDLSDQVVGLQSLFSNKQARGAFGEVQLNNIIKDFIPSSIYKFQATLSNGKRPDCLLDLPNPPGPIAIDAKFPLESYRALNNAKNDSEHHQASIQLSKDVKKHIKDIAEKYIVPGETTDGALMFLPSEAVYAELHTNFMNVVEESHRNRVYIVSPSTLMAFLNSMRALLKDVNMREQAGLIQNEVRKMMRNIELLDERVGKLGRSFATAQKAYEEIQTSSGRIKSDISRIEDIQLQDESPADDLEPSQASDKISGPTA